MREAFNSKSGFLIAGSVVAIGLAAAVAISVPNVLTQAGGAHRTFLST
jgi:SNF family Na+-dependent transporter